MRAYADMALAAGAGRDEALEDRLREYMYGRLDAHGCDPDPAWREEIIGGDIRLNTQGLVVWLSRQVSAAGTQ